MEPRLWILIQAFAHLLPPGDVIDAGANDGAFLIEYLPTYEAKLRLGDAAEHGPQE